MLALVGSIAILHVESHHSTSKAAVAKNSTIARIVIVPVSMSFTTYRIGLLPDLVIAWPFFEANRGR